MADCSCSAWLASSSDVADICSAAEEMSATSEELASQAEQLQSAISYFRIEGGAEQTFAAPARARGKVPAKKDLRDAILAGAPHMASRKSARSTGGGFDLDLDNSPDDLDAEFSRRNAA